MGSGSIDAGVCGLLEYVTNVDFRGVSLWRGGAAGFFRGENATRVLWGELGRVRSSFDGESGLGLLVGVSGIRVSSMSTSGVAGLACGALRLEGESFEGRARNAGFLGDRRGVVVVGVLEGELFLARASLWICDFRGAQTTLTCFRSLEKDLVTIPLSSVYSCWVARFLP